MRSGTAHSGRTRVPFGALLSVELELGYGAFGVPESVVCAATFSRKAAEVAFDRSSGNDHADDSHRDGRMRPVTMSWLSHKTKWRCVSGHRYRTASADVNVGGIVKTHSL